MAVSAITTRPTTTLSVATRQTPPPTVLTTLLTLPWLLQHILHPPALVPTTLTATIIIGAVYPKIHPTTRTTIPITPAATTHTALQPAR